MLRVTAKLMQEAQGTHSPMDGFEQWRGSFDNLAVTLIVLLHMKHNAHTCVAWGADFCCRLAALIVNRVAKVADFYQWVPA